MLPWRKAEGTPEWWFRREVTAGPRYGWVADSEAEERSRPVRFKVEAENC